MGANASMTTGTDAASWDTETVVAMLDGLGPAMACYGQAVADNAVNGEMMLTLTSEDLGALGVENAFHKRRLLAEIDHIKNRSPPHSSGWSDFWSSPRCGGNEAVSIAVRQQSEVGPKLHRTAAIAPMAPEPRKKKAPSRPSAPAAVEEQEQPKFVCGEPGCAREFKSEDGLGLHQEWHNSRNAEALQLGESSSNPVNYAALSGALDTFDGTELEDERSPQPKLPTAPPPEPPPGPEPPVEDQRFEVPTGISEWLASVSPHLEQYAESLLEYGYIDTDVLMEATHEDIERAMNEIRMKLPLQRLFVNACDAIRSHNQLAAVNGGVIGGQAKDKEHKLSFKPDVSRELEFTSGKQEEQMQDFTQAKRSLRLAEPQWSSRRLLEHDVSTERRASGSSLVDSVADQAPFCGNMLSTLQQWSEHLKLIFFILVFVVYFELCMWFQGNDARGGNQYVLLCRFFGFLPLSLSSPVAGVALWMIAAPDHISHRQAKRYAVVLCMLQVLSSFLLENSTWWPGHQWLCGEPISNPLPVNCTEDDDCTTLESWMLFKQRNCDIKNITNATGACVYSDKHTCPALIHGKDSPLIHQIGSAALFAVWWAIPFIILPYIFRHAPGLGGWQNAQMVGVLSTLLMLIQQIYLSFVLIVWAKGAMTPLCEKGNGTCFDLGASMFSVDADPPISYVAPAMAAVLMILIARIAIFDSVVSFQNPIRKSFGYVTALVGLVLFFPFICAGLMTVLIETIGTGSQSLVLVLVLWSSFLTAVYLLTRTMAVRAIAYTSIPLVVFPFQLVGDLFAEMVLVDFEVRDWEFWIVIVFDVFLLVMRDADLWTDFTAWVREKSGRLGSLLIAVAQLISGDSDELGDHLYSVSVSKQTNAPSQEDQEKVKRELTENCVVSELLSTFALITLISLHMLLDAMGLEGAPSFNNSLDHEKRVDAIKVYFIILLMQIIGINISHHIIRNKNEYAAKLLSLQAQRKEMPIPPGCKWHFFLSHMQANAGDAVDSLCLELERLGFACWYDQHASDLTKRGMEEGVARSNVFLLFLSDGVMGREYVHHEVREAMRLRKMIITIYEHDPRHGAVDFAREKRQAPLDLKGLFEDIESLPWRRRAFERQAMLRELMKRAGQPYFRHFQKFCERPTKMERQLSSISPHSIFFDKNLRLRVLLAITTVTGCLFSSGIIMFALRQSVMNELFRD